LLNFGTETQCDVPHELEDIFYENLKAQDSCVEIMVWCQPYFYVPSSQLLLVLGNTELCE